jgi:hypothetical protein
MPGQKLENGPKLVKAIRYIREGTIEFQTNGVQSSHHYDRDAASDQRVFDCSCAGLITQEALKLCHRNGSGIAAQANRAFITKPFLMDFRFRSIAMSQTVTGKLATAVFKKPRGLVPQRCNETFTNLQRGPRLASIHKALRHFL